MLALETVVQELTWRWAEHPLAMNNLQKLYKEYLTGLFKLEIIDLLVNPVPGWAGWIVVIGMDVGRFPVPTAKGAGFLLNVERALVALQSQPCHQIRWS